MCTIVAVILMFQAGMSHSATALDIPDLENSQAIQAATAESGHDAIHIRQILDDFEAGRGIARDERIVFEGMVPVLMQAPPTTSRISTSATFLPSLDA